MEDYEKHTQVYSIPLDVILVRKENGYSIGGIDALAGSIERTGLIHPIILQPEGELFRIVDGERRFRAMKELRDRFEKVGDTVRAKIYSTIPAIVRGNLSAEEENRIYRDSNDYARQLTNFERIVRLDPETIDLKEQKWQDEYRRLSGKKPEEKIRPTRREVSKLIRLILLESEPELDISEKTIRNYLAFLDRCGPELRSAAVMGLIAVRDAQLVSWLNEDEQRDAVEAAGTDQFEDYVLEGKYQSGSDSRRKKRQKKTEKMVAEAYIKKLIRLEADYEKALAMVKSSDMAEGEDKQKLEHVKHIMQEIRELI
jgi:ParB-like chromosome segregation protein Spo0J